MTKSPVWRAALREASDSARVQRWLESLAAVLKPRDLATASSEQARLMVALGDGSEALSATLLSNPDWAEVFWEPGSVVLGRQLQGLRKEIQAWLPRALEDHDYISAFSRLRQFKQREMLRIALRDLSRLGLAPQITRELSDLADVCLNGVLQICTSQLRERFGEPWHQGPDGEWQATHFTVLGLGKLGGQELNYSSDVDLMLVYSEEGSVFKSPPRMSAASGQGMTNHQWFKRLAEAFLAEVTRPAPEGMLYRVDLRLRPEGAAGPLVRSLSSYENYYAQWGQPWERMMLIKARGAAGDTALAAEFLEVIQPFRYPRSLSPGVLREVAAMKDRIEAEVVRTGELERNVKLGRGGIREIEFVVQTLQLLHAGRIPFLQNAQTLPTLDKLAQYKLITFAEARDLAGAYPFLRDVEHRLQMEHNRQTHTIPEDAMGRKRLAWLMGFRNPADFDAALREHTRRVRQTYDRLLRAETPEPVSKLPRQFQGAEAEWGDQLREFRFRDPVKAVRLLNEFASGPGYVHVSPRTVELAWQLIPRFLELCRKHDKALPSQQPPASQGRSRLISDPDRVLARLDSFVSAYGARATLFETWTHNPSLFELLLLLFDRSEFLAETAIRTPDLVDDLVLSDRLRRSKTAAETLADLRHGRDDVDQRLWLRRYHQAEFTRIGLRDILGLADFEQNHVELSALADACLHYALEAMLRKHRLKGAAFAVIGLGKLGGVELTYGSDLDIMFVADGKMVNLPKLQKIAHEVMDMLSSSTELGVAFKTDARLRPDGEKGLLVNTLAAYEDYYRQRAQLWEIQALTRTRPVAGDMKVGERFQRMAAQVTNFKAPTIPVVARAADWKHAIARMRRRIEKERTPAGQDALAFKTGAGGLVDAEFLAQALCLEHGWQEANTLRALERARDSGALERGDADKLISNYRELRRVESILRRWSFEGETVLPVEDAPYYRVSVRCGFDTPEEFREAIAAYRRAIREVYAKYFAV